ncbi:MAG: excinuclease ABC subunit UvrC, partial [Firmicutes bacterium]|nr:excinuclease ABC subunit UvrC [Bacillota bacterium]
TYPYIKVTVNEMFPRMYMTRIHKKDKAKYFGPYTSSFGIKENIELITRSYPIRRCMKKFPRDIGKERPCLNYHIGKCKAPCNNLISEEEYNKMIEGVINFLSGKYEDILKELEKKMYAYSQEMEYEKAAEMRDKINAVKKLGERQNMENMNMEDRDVIGMARAFNEAVFQMFFIRNGKMTGRENFLVTNADGMEREELITDFIKRYYSGTPYIPKEIMTREKIYDKDAIGEWLSHVKGKKVTFVSPKKGERLRLIELAEKNAMIFLEQKSEEALREEKRTTGALDEIKEALGIDFKLERVESYDISNTQGFESVASMVVFENGRPKRSDYRKFKIKSVIGPNDFASMYEVITRRFLRYKKEKEENAANGRFDKLPDMIFLDGGKGQISAVKKAFDDVGISVPVCGMIKDDKHRTRGLIYENREIYINTHSEGFKLLTRIQDEVHRFAIDYHRRLRAKDQIRSVLDDIEGIGDVRRKNLMKHFGSIEKIRYAEVEELCEAEGMNRKAAEAVYNFFRKR